MMDLLSKKKLTFIGFWIQTIHMYVCMLFAGDLTHAVEVFTSSVVEVFRYEDAKLFCNYSADVPSKFTVSWMHGKEQILRCGINCTNITNDEYEINVLPKTRTSKLVIRDADFADIGNYTCILVTNRAVARSVVDLKVKCEYFIPDTMVKFPWFIFKWAWASTWSLSLCCLYSCYEYVGCGSLFRRFVNPKVRYSEHANFLYLEVR